MHLNIQVMIQTFLAYYMKAYHAPSFDDLASNSISDTSGTFSPGYEKKKKLINY